MKKYLGCLALLLVLGGSMRGQSSLPVVQGNVSASSTNCSTAFSCVWQNALAFNASTTTVAVSGTFTATLLVEESNNGGQTWATIATLSAAGTTTYSTNGFTDIRVRCSAFTSGTATITLNTGLTTGGGSGGGGAVSSVFSRTGAVVATANDYSVAQLSGLPCTAPQGCTGVASPTAHADPQAEGASVYNFIGPGLTGQVKTAINGADPSYKSPGLSGTDVNSATYLVQCDSGTALLDRGTTLRFITTTPTVTVPDPTAAGCGSNFAFTMVASGVTATVNRTSTAVFNIYGRSGDPTLAATTFNLTTGQYATVSSPDNTNWLVRIVPAAGAGSGASGLVTILTKTANYTTVSGDFSAAATPPTEVIYAVTTATTVTHTLPSTVTTSGAYQVVKNSCTSTFGLYVAPANALTLDGDTTNMFLPPCNQLTITSDGTNWRSSLWENRQANLGTYFPFNALDRFGFNAPSGANVSQVYTFQLEKPVKISKITFLYTVGAAASTGDYGVYDQGGNLVTHTGSQSTAVGTNQFVQAATSPVVTLAPGVYTIAMCDSSVTPTFAQVTISGFVNNMAFAGTSTFGMGQGATACTAGVLPATLGAVTYNNTQAGAVLMVVTP